MFKDFANVEIDETKLFKSLIVDASTGKEYTAYDLEIYANQIASGLYKDISPKAKVAILSENSYKYVSLYIGIRRLGLTPVLINVKMSSEQIEKILDHSDAELIFYENQFLDTRKDSES